MIDVEEHGIEVGDRIRITIEGVVEKGGLYDPCAYSVNGFGIGRVHSSISVAPTVEILEKADPAWWSAKVIRATDENGARGYMVKATYFGADDGSWVDSNFNEWFRTDLLDVEVIVP